MITHTDIDDNPAGCPNCAAPTGGSLCVNPVTPGAPACVDLDPDECPGCHRGMDETLLYRLDGADGWECIDRRATGSCPRSLAALEHATTAAHIDDELWCHLVAEIYRHRHQLTNRQVDALVIASWSRADQWTNLPTVTEQAAHHCDDCDQATAPVRAIPADDPANATGSHLWGWQCPGCRTRQTVATTARPRI